LPRLSLSEELKEDEFSHVLEEKEEVVDLPPNKPTL
jgi:hypothetical protein